MDSLVHLMLLNPSSLLSVKGMRLALLDHCWRCSSDNPCGLWLLFPGLKHANALPALQGCCRYTQNAKDMLEAFFNGKPFPDESFYIVREGKLADQYS